MAIVRTIQCRGGGVIHVTDDCYKGKGAAEIEALRAETRRAAGRILRQIAGAEQTAATDPNPPGWAGALKEGRRRH